MPTINNPDEDVMSELRARLPGWTAEERALWLDLLEAFSVPLLPTAEEVVDKQPREREE